jgi:hypothetical protein
VRFRGWLCWPWQQDLLTVANTEQNDLCLAPGSNPPLACCRIHVCCWSLSAVRTMGSWTKSSSSSNSCPFQHSCPCAAYTNSTTKGSTP